MTKDDLSVMSPLEYKEMVHRYIKEDQIEEGNKHDKGKPRLDLIPPEALFSLGKVLKFGADKYEDRNWEKGFDWGRAYGALSRHLWAWWQGEDKDPESGLSHLDHALANIAFLITFEQRKIGTDTRSKG